MTWSMDTHQFTKLGWVEYVFVSTSLALVIAKFFPAVHNQIVSRATRLEHQNLYWGTAVVSNVFTYGLLFAAMRGWSIIEQFMYMQSLVSYTDHLCFAALCIASAQEVVINVILFVGALVGSLRSTIMTPIPPGIGGCVTNLSFCWSCFCCCVCCSPRCRAKTMRVLVLFSFMVFIYSIVMAGISVVFVLFIEESRTSVITCSLFIISLIVFLVFFVSFLLFSLSWDRNNDASFCQQFIECFGGVCMLTTVFLAVMLMVVMYMIIVFSLNLKGVTGIVTGLIPTIALSAASWYIKKRLGKRLSFSRKSGRVHNN